MAVNKSCLYLLLYLGVQWNFGTTVPQTKLEPLYRSESAAAVEGLNYDQLESSTVQHDTTKRVIEGSQISMSFLEERDTSENLSSPGKDKDMRISEINENTFLANGPSVNYAVEKPSQIILNNKLCHQIEGVKDGINKQSIVKNATSTSSTFVAPSYYSNKFAELENNINNMDEIIEQLKIFMSFSEEDKKRFAVLEDRVDNLEDRRDNENRGDNQERDKLKSTIDEISNKMDSLQAYFSALQKEVTEKGQSQTQKRLTNECIEEIRSHNFAAAEGKLDLIEDENKINLIVHQVYNYEAANFYLVLEAGNTIRNISRRFLIYKALNYEIENNGHRDPSKMIRLIESFKKEMDNKENATTDTRNKSLITDIEQSLKTVVKEKLKEGLLHDRYASVVDIGKIIYDFKEEMFKELIREVIKEVREGISTEKLLNNIYSESKYVEQTAATYFALLDVMEENDEFNTPAMFKVAYRIKKAIGSHDSNFLRLTNRLPDSVKNAVFASKVCIKNVLRREYLYCAHNNTYDRNKTRVYTWISGDRVAYSEWLIEPVGDNFRIKNCMYGKYLYSTGPHNNAFRSDSGYVFTWVPGTKVSEILWKIEPDGNDCQINSAERNEYLYSGIQTFDNKNRYVFTWLAGNRLLSSKWKIEDCS